MARPYIRRALKRAGVAVRPRAEADRPPAPRIPPPRVFLPEETEDAGPIDLASLFGRSAPVELEIGTGKGRFLLESAAARPDRSWLGLEIEREYCALARLRAARRGLSNLRVESLDGREFVIRRLPPASLAGLHVYFPDPWPKKRHHKRRLFTPAFAAAAARALVPGSLFRVASDHPDYWATIEEVLTAEPLLARLSEAEAGPWASGTNYELKFAASGRPVFKAVFRRTGG
ncbi:MAG TPA: tRNA (guanosine(46)-N7)-methyltransferase TrmB [Thermoanaerobaculia bacterium]|nr:tRNA (guanosine(46)-N7)-methyltransferase TrmB [Thermoanaerobaculia bacterium]